MSALAKFLGIYHKSGLRGSHRLTRFLADRMKSLQSIPIQTENGTLYADLRINSAHGLSATPKSESGEDLVMRRIVKSGDVVFDIGAHHGYYTLLLSELVGETGKVFAFEPNTEMIPNLKRTIKPLANVKLFPMGLSDQAGERTLFVPEEASMASLSDWTNGIGGKVHQVNCRMEVLDDLLRKAQISVPQFIKCDVEGAELSVFKGAVEILNRADAPVIMFEVVDLAAKSFGAKTADYFNFLGSLEKTRYNFFEVSTEGIRKLDSREIKYANVLAVPETKLNLCQILWLRS